MFINSQHSALRRVHLWSLEVNEYYLLIDFKIQGCGGITVGADGGSGAIDSLIRPPSGQPFVPDSSHSVELTVSQRF